jgi:hypothetical protein
MTNFIEIEQKQEFCEIVIFFIVRFLRSKTEKIFKKKIKGQDACSSLKRSWQPSENKDELVFALDKIIKLLGCFDVMIRSK